MSFTIDCETCPVRGRHCGDCMVPVLAKVWLADPPVRAAEPAGESGVRAAGLPLDFEETEAVEAFVRAGLISRAEASGVRAQSTSPSIAAG
ncbi:hypothetical protein MWU75_17845 [Ornithinimicrobium sp. F0845]|uniref:hypothetical protein n=1 Tax=Ornithinimicrobium sp. F0845 TaxID=2926412 RepID=UPI001FF3E22C|nr:hypothetical protein [Ornithinimicrobium sp. F0845]MCK0114008.1 hypothetical protein [Ornithinimicrobium sp. F0845]